MTRHEERATARATPVADAVSGSWVDTRAPVLWRPYLRLARLDRPIGTWLLLLPCWWGACLAGLETGAAALDLGLLALFAIGAVVMRGAGCTWNDIVDREYDAKVDRTRGRPIPSGQVSVTGALVFAVLLSLVGLAVLVALNGFTIALAISSLALVAIYPFMKRFTYWPQLFLGLAFNWGALTGWAAVTGGLAPAPILLYAGAVLWTLAYDTIYAHQDADDDLTAGLKSTALRFGAASVRWIAAFFAGAVVLWTAAAMEAGAGRATLLSLLAVSAHFAWQTVTLDTASRENCLARFRSNRDAGLLLFAGLAGDLLVGGVQ